MIKDATTINKTAPVRISSGSETGSPAISPDFSNWQQELAAAYRDPHALAVRLGLADADTPEPVRAVWRKAAQTFPLLVSESYVQRMNPADWNDPLLRQVWPDESELIEVAGFTEDAVGDRGAVQSPGVLHKYAGRALMVTLGQCAIHCRYCFRRHYPYAESPRTVDQWRDAFQFLRTNPEIDEIILSGGDPLILSDRRLGELLALIEEFPQIHRLRIHSRLPIVLPSRVTTGLLDTLQTSRLQTIFVVHANHPQEIVADCADALQRLVQAGMPVLNQAVLLRGINDTLPVQTDLCRRLINRGVIPYYLHQLDRVRGAAHFEVDPQLGRELISGLKQTLPGYAVPRYVQEIPGEPGKTELLSL